MVLDARGTEMVILRVDIVENRKTARNCCKQYFLPVYSIPLNWRHLWASVFVW